MRRFMTILLGVVCGGAPCVGLAATGASATKRLARSARRVSREDAWVARTIARMTLPEEVGQLFEVNGYGTTVRDRNPMMVKLNRRYYGVDNIAGLIKKYHVGGIIYFAWTNNFGAGAKVNPAQIVGLSNGIQRVAMSQRTQVPMVISTDQEQGEVLRIGSPATVFPGNMALGATRDAKLARQAASITGVELRAMGINVDNAPVTDVNINPRNQADGIRAYGDRISLVSNLGVAQVKGYQTRQATTGVGATSKHFPGFGDTTSNSDFSKTISPQTLSQVKRMNFPTPRASIKAGVARVMVTHILFPKVTGGRIPSSMSRFWITKMLRG
jgi:beta-N-acetylhexosaminidase